MGDGGRRGIRGSGVRDLRVRQRESESKAMVGAKMTAKALMVRFQFDFILTGVPFSRPVVLSSVTAGDKVWKNSQPWTRWSRC